ncbi:hypothetical protein TWF694_010475 [Orbilia ellipsospora]|uniref:Myb-like DNA-binding domain-containing protein n=1 Tax=Orbilia ellipsospora TaxID=2528407 RepID=A0AAV9XAC3_9PEZI
MSRHHPAPDSDTMKELILMQAIINAYNLPPKFDLAAKALKITAGAASSRYSRIKKKIEAAGEMYPLYQVGPDGKHLNPRRGRPPKKLKIAVPVKPLIITQVEDDENNDENDELKIFLNTTKGSGSQMAKSYDHDEEYEEGEDDDVYRKVKSEFEEERNQFEASEDKVEPIESEIYSE